MKLEDIGLPSMGPSMRIDHKKYAVRYAKFCLDHVEKLAELEILETRGMEGKDIVIMSKEKFNFMDKYYVVLNYLEKKPE